MTLFFDRFPLGYSMAERCTVFQSANRASVVRTGGWLTTAVILLRVKSHLLSPSLAFWLNLPCVRRPPGHTKNIHMQTQKRDRWERWSWLELLMIQSQQTMLHRYHFRDCLVHCVRDSPGPETSRGKSRGVAVRSSITGMGR